MKTNKVLRSIILTYVIIWFSACDNDDKDSSVAKNNYGIFTIIDDKTVQMDGDIDSSTLRHFESMVKDYPNITKINIKEVPGSLDDETNLQVSRKVHERNIATHILDEGLVASGGTDFFLAGTTRTIGNNVRIGVHSWSDGKNEATDFPEDHEDHQFYVDYYVAIGFTQENAKNFYFFTINAASADSIHWMTEAEIEQYKILKP